MAVEGRREILVETDFLFGLNPEDRLHKYVIRLISLHKRKKLQCYLAGTALFEFRTVLYSHGLKSSDVHEAFLIILNTLEENDVDVISVRPKHILSADYLRTRYPELTFFDSLHAGVALEEGIPLASYDRIYERIEEISWINLTTL